MLATPVSLCSVRSSPSASSCCGLGVAVVPLLFLVFTPQTSDVRSVRGAKVPKETKGEFYFIIRVGESQHKTKLRRMKDMDSMNAKFTL